MAKKGLLQHPHFEVVAKARISLLTIILTMAGIKLAVDSIKYFLACWHFLKIKKKS